MPMDRLDRLDYDENWLYVNIVVFISVLLCVLYHVSHHESYTTCLRKAIKFTILSKIKWISFLDIFKSIIPESGTHL